MSRGLALVFAAFALTYAAPANALLCTPLIGCTCNVSVSAVAFGDIQPFSGAPATTTGDIGVQCTNVIDVAPLVYAEIGASQNGPIANRRMRAPSGALLAYNLYHALNYATIVGQGGAYPRLAISGGLLNIGGWNATAHVYALAPAAPTAPPGDYTDTVTVRIEW